MLKAASVGQAERKLQALPLLSHGVMELELIELEPFAALEMLFPDSTGASRA